MIKRLAFQLFFGFTVFLLPASILVALFSQGPLAWLSGLIYIGYDTVLLIFVTLSILQVLRSKSPAAVIPRPIRIAVLIAARNEGNAIFECLQALRLQTLPAAAIHLIDDGSTDETADGVSKVFPEVHVWKKNHTGKADSLNCVWPKVEAEVLVTLDADTILDPKALEELTLAFQDPLLCAAGGVLTPTCVPANCTARLFETFQRFEYIRAFLSRRAWMQQQALLLVSGAFGAYRKSVLAEVGGFNTSSLVEDYDLIHRIHRFAFEHGAERRVAVIARARATTDSPATIGAFLKQRQRWFAGFLQTHFQNWKLVGNDQYGAVGRIMLPIKSLDTLQPIYGIVAFVTFICLLVTRAELSPLLFWVIGTKLIFDLCFHFWSVALYHRWQERSVHKTEWLVAALVSLVEPFSFQLLRHCGAALGWLSLVRRSHEWTPLPKTPR